MVCQGWELFLGRALPAAPAGIACTALVLSALWLHRGWLEGRSGIQVHCPKNSRLRVPKTRAKQLGASRLFGQILLVSPTFGVFIIAALFSDCFQVRCVIRLYACSLIVLSREQPGQGPKRHQEWEHSTQAASCPEVSPLGQAGEKLKPLMRRKPASEASYRQQSEVGLAEELLGFGSRATRRRLRAGSQACCRLSR